MSGGAYDDYAEWYDRYVREQPIYRDVVSPSMLELAGDVAGQRVLDLACGQGWLARALAQRGAHVTGVDRSTELLALAHRYEEAEPLGIVYVRDDAQTLAGFESATFDGVICTLALMDIPDYEAALRSARRVLAPGGWLIFSLTHPCFQSPFARAAFDTGAPTRMVRRYLTEGYWRSDAEGVRSKLGSYHRTLSSYLNALLAAGFALERMTEPRATGDRLAEEPGDGEFPALLFVRARAR